MCISRKDYENNLKIVYEQTQETVQQSLKGVCCRMATVTCPCGRERGLPYVYKCLYCGIYYCEPCAEAHFGKTKEQYRLENPIGD